MTIEHETAGIRAIVRDRSALCGKVGKDRCDQFPVAGCAETVADDELRRCAAIAGQRRHRMEIDQQDRAPLFAHALDQRFERGMVGLMNRGDPFDKVGIAQPPLPQFADPRQATRHQPQPAACAMPGMAGSRRSRMRCRSRRVGQHIPIDIVDRAIEIDHRTRRFGHEKARTGFARHCIGKTIDQSIFKPQQDVIGRAQGCQNMRRIAPPAMRRSQNDRNRCRFVRQTTKCPHARQPRNRPAADFGGAWARIADMIACP